MVKGPNSNRVSRLRRAALFAATACVVGAGVFGAGAASAYVGDSFLQVPDAKGHYKGAEHLNWIRAEANAWSTNISTVGIGGFGGPMNGGPGAPRPGTAAKLHVMLSKTNPDTALLMDRCKNKVTMPEMTYSESWGRAHPAAAPAFLNYKLKNVQVVDCPVLDGAIAQAFVISFQDIEWLNYTPPPARGGGRGGGRGAGGQGGGQAGAGAPGAVVAQGGAPAQAGAAGRGGAPAAGGAAPQGNVAAQGGGVQGAQADNVVLIEPAEATKGKKVKAYLVSWLGIATNSRPEDCPVMNSKPTEEDFYRFRTPEEVAAYRKKLGDKGLGQSAESEWRGPNNLNVNVLPGIVPDPGLREPKSNVALGFNLDGDNGAGAPPKGIKKHKNYTSPSGVTGVDNQAYTVLGCVPGFRGKDGYRIQTDNARRADGNIVTIIEVSGIDNELNDPEVEVALIHSSDKPIRDNAGKVFVGGYTFRPTSDPRFAAYNMKWKGRIVNGVVETSVAPKYSVNSGQGPAYDLFLARMRIEPQANGNVKAFLGGYLDWRYYSTFMSSGYSEGLFGYQQPAVYYAFKRNADGLYDPATGEYNGISAAYELDGVPAFMTPMPKVEKVAAK